MAWETLNSGRIEQIMRQITGKKLDASTNMISPAMIKGSGIIFLWAPTKKTLMKVNRGIRVYVVSYEMDEKDRILTIVVFWVFYAFFGFEITVITLLAAILGNFWSNSDILV